MRWPHSGAVDRKCPFRLFYMPMKRVSFKTIGCRLNQAETAQMAARFEAEGYSIVPFGQPCDICVIHTCCVTRKAERTCMRFARMAKRSKSRPLVVLAGCAVEIDPERLKEECGAHLAVGQKDKFRLTEIAADVRKPAESKPAAAPTAPAQEERKDAKLQVHAWKMTTPVPRFETKRAVIRVQDGCDFRCSYCIVPLARGKPVGRPCREILEEIRLLADAGFKEFVLTGANLACYEDGPWRLVDLLEEIEELPRVARIRLSSIEVSTTERAVIDYMAQSEKLCHSIHLPLQSGDDRILAAMGRRYTSAEYRSLAEYAVEKVPLVGLGTDIIVGFPGEDKTMFSNSVKMVRSLPFSNLHIFPYSKRPGTRAATMPGQVKNEEKDRRAAVLAKLGMEKRRSFARNFIGRTVSVLIEGVTADGVGTGWTGEYLEAQLPGPANKINTIVRFTPTGVRDDVLV